MNITFANSKVEKYFTDYRKMQKELPADWVRTIKSIWTDLKQLSALVIFWRWD